MKICALIPVYNNAQTIGQIVERCRTVIEPDILVISDGSTDGSDVIAKQSGAWVERLQSNQGKGHAIRHGMRVALGEGYTHALVLDADGQHQPEEIPNLINASWNFPEKIWIGVRRMDKNSTPASSRRGRAISNFWTTVDGWQRCRDAQCGFRVYPIEETLDLRCRELGFAFEMEVLIRAAWAGLRFGHLDIDVLYPEEGRVSHFDKKKDNLRFTWLSFRMFCQMLLRSPILTFQAFKNL
jgi:glycosyltransferase involved in cell wall biosynthesis